jgi:excisionase family DNA binding protein
MASIQQFLPLLHSKREAARILGVSIRTLHSLIAEKQLRTVRIGRRVLVAHAELMRFCERDHQTSHLCRSGKTSTTKRTRNQLVQSSVAAVGGGDPS